MNNIILPLDWQIAAGVTVTEESLQAAATAQRYRMREQFPETYLRFADLYHELTKQEPTKATLSEWMMTFETWKQEGFEDEHIRGAWLEANKDPGGFFVGRPAALTNTARAIKSRMVSKPQSIVINEKAIMETKQLIAEKWQGNFVPRPANCPRPNIGGAK